MELTCPLCGSSDTHFYHKDKKRQYFQCPQCKLVFADPCNHLSATQEKAEYDLHQNDVSDEGYLTFLNKLAKPLQSKLLPNSQGLDFGCGPGPALAMLLEQQGHHVALYDIYYYPEQSVLNKKYDFVTCTEAIEHFNTPVKEWQLLTKLVKPGGHLALMTKLVINQDRFSTWHYKNDPTHVSFFSKDTFDYLARANQLNVEYIGNDVIIFSGF